MHFPRLHRWLKLKTSALASVFRDRLFHMWAGVPKGCHRCWWCWAMPVPQRLGVQEEEETDLLRGRWRRSKQSISRATKNDTRFPKKKSSVTMKIDVGKNLPKLKFLLWLYDWIAYCMNQLLDVCVLHVLIEYWIRMPTKQKSQWNFYGSQIFPAKMCNFLDVFFWGHGF